MSKIKYIRRKCPGCKETYKFSLQRILDGGEFKCPTCGRDISITELQEMSGLINRYNEIIIEIESMFEFEEDTPGYKVPQNP